MSNQIVGTCSLCGGKVVVPFAWWGIYPPVPQCEDCGAVQKNQHGPTIEMENPKVSTTTITTSGGEYIIKWRRADD